MCNKKYIMGIVFFFVLITMSCSVTAIPPVQTTTTIAEQTNGMIIEYIQDDNIQVDEPFEYQFHVYNSSNGLLLDNTTISCKGHMYDKKGMLILTLIAETQEENGAGFYFNATGGNFTTPGIFSYQAHCNDSTKGGYVSGTIRVSQGGNTPTPEETSLLGYLFFAAIIFWILCLIGYNTINDKHEYDIGGNLISVNFNKYIKMGLGFLAYLFTIIITFMAWKMSIKFLTFNFAFIIFDTIFTILWISVIIVFVALIPVTIIKVVGDMKLWDLANRNLKPYGGKKR